MKYSLIKLVALCAVCASFAAVPSMASAQSRHDRERTIARAEAQITKLQAQRARARRHHDWNRVKTIDGAIAAERAVIRSARHR